MNPANNQNYTFLGRNGGNIRPNRVGDPNSGIDPKVDRLHFLDSAAFAVQGPEYARQLQPQRRAGAEELQHESELGEALHVQRKVLD
ncbi:MAG: hypothetical protein WDO18_02585 [Acidobacteriota bacterium]